MSIGSNKIPKRISASRIPPFLLVRYAARRSELEVNGKARMYPTRVAIARRPELVWLQLYGGAVIFIGKT
jgi:hypothetical protein